MNDWRDLKGIHKPKDGWIPQTWYLVTVKTHSTNPVHTALLFTGFLDSKGNPAGYSGVIAANFAPTEAADPVESYYYVNPICRLIDSNGQIGLEPESGESEFDEDAAIEYFNKRWADKLLQRAAADSNIDMARWQHQQSQAAIRALKIEVEFHKWMGHGYANQCGIHRAELENQAKEIAQLKAAYQNQSEYWVREYNKLKATDGKGE